MNRCLLILALVLAGCGVSYEPPPPCPEVDAGVLPESDAATLPPDAGSDAGPPMSERWPAYGNILCELARQRAEANGCETPVCLWDGTETCEPNAVRICVLVLTLQSDSCPSLESAWNGDCIGACS